MYISRTGHHPRTIKNIIYNGTGEGRKVWCLKITDNRDYIQLIRRWETWIFSTPIWFSDSLNERSLYNLDRIRLPLNNSTLANDPETPSFSFSDIRLEDLRWGRSWCEKSTEWFTRRRSRPESWDYETSLNLRWLTSRSQKRRPGSS